LTIVDERVEEIRKALQMCNGKYEIQLIDFPKKTEFDFQRNYGGCSYSMRKFYYGTKSINTSW
jgi:hypothetical protein